MTPPKHLSKIKALENQLTIKSNRENELLKEIQFWKDKDLQNQKKFLSLASIQPKKIKNEKPILIFQKRKTPKNEYNLIMKSDIDVLDQELTIAEDLQEINENDKYLVRTLKSNISKTSVKIIPKDSYEGLLLIGTNKLELSDAEILFANQELNLQLQKCLTKFVFPKGLKAIKQKNNQRKNIKDVYFFIFPLLLKDIYVNCICVSYYEQISNNIIAPRIMMRTSQNEDYQMRKEELVTIIQKMQYGESPLQDFQIQSRTWLKEEPPLEIIDFFANYLKELIFLFLNLLLENSVVILGDQVYLISETIFLLLELIKPIKWVNIMIASVPKELIEILHSPIPFLVGMIDQEELIPKNIIICKVSKQNVKIMNLEEEKMIVESNQFKKLMQECEKRKSSIDLIKIFQCFVSEYCQKKRYNKSDYFERGLSISQSLSHLRN